MGCGCSNTEQAIVTAKSAASKSKHSLTKIFTLPLDCETKKAVADFNAGNPKAALASLSLDSDAKAAASWLHHTPGLDCAILGDLLGDPNQTPLMQAYIYKFAFARLGLEAALRMLLRSFRLPDAAYVVSFALIMLNTDLHNPSVKRKMSQEQFINAISGVEGGSDFPKNWMEQLYCSIRDNEIVMECKLTKRQLPIALNSDLPEEVVAQSKLLGKFRGVVHMVKADPGKVSSLLKRVAAMDDPCCEPDQEVYTSPHQDSMMSI